MEMLSHSSSINKSELRTEQLPDSEKSDYINFLIEQIQTDESLSQREVNDKLELVLIERIQCKCSERKKCKCHSVQNRFILGQFYFDACKYIKSYEIFDTIKDECIQALYQLAVILYDDLLNKDEGLGPEDRMRDNVEIDMKASFKHPNAEFWKYGFECMHKIASGSDNAKLFAHHKTLIHLAQYNVGKAYFQGFGCKQSDAQTEKWWLLAADDGNALASVSAQTALAFFYSRKNDPEYFDLKKAYFWHNEACGNGSLESQGSLGAMYYFGLGCKRDIQAAYECLTHASERGNVYAMGLLGDYYYRNRFYVKSAELSKKVALLYDLDKIARETMCLKSFIAKGISLACFTHARCLDLGKGIDRNVELAKKFYRRSYYFDPDLCQLYQNQTTHEKI